MPNERNQSNFWRNVGAGVGVAAAGAALAYLASEVAESVFGGEQSNNGRHHNNRPKSTPPSRRCNSQNDTNNVFSELRKNIADKLNSGTYDCPICLDDINKNSQTISCSTCYQIFHLICLREYFCTSRNVGNPPACPCCRTPSSSNLVYKCFCGKKVNPPPVEGLTPHSCGEICGRNSACRIVCHPGPCL